MAPRGRNSLIFMVNHGPSPAVFPWSCLLSLRKSMFIQNIPKRKTPVTSSILPRIACLALILLYFVNLILKIYPNILHPFLGTLGFFNITLTRMRCILNIEGYKQQQKVPLCNQICLKSFNCYPTVDSKSKGLELKKLQNHRDFCIWKWELAFSHR